MADSPVTPVQIKATLADPTSTVCGNLISTLLKFPILIYQFFNWMLDSDGNFTSAYKAALSRFMIKPGDLIFSAAPLDADGRLLCDGSTVSRATYTALFTAIGTTYGAGDGSTTFKLPDYRNAFPVGAGDAYQLADHGGEDQHTLSAAELPAHNHASVTGNDQLLSTANGIPTAPTAATTQAGTVNDGATPFASCKIATVGTGQAHNNLPPYVACFIYIKV